MNISNLNVRIRFQKNAVVIDKIGNHTNEWQDYYSCYATVSGETGTMLRCVSQCDTARKYLPLSRQNTE